MNAGLSQTLFLAQQVNPKNKDIDSGSTGKVEIISNLAWVDDCQYYLAKKERYNKLNQHMWHARRKIKKYWNLG